MGQHIGASKDYSVLSMDPLELVPGIWHIAKDKQWGVIKRGGR